MKRTPQEAWNNTIQVAAETAPSSLKSYMDQLAECENVPRKEKQFRNFTVNSLKLRGPSGERAKGEIWALLVKARDDEKKIREEQEKEDKEAKLAAQKQNEVDQASKKSNSQTVSDSDDESGSSSDSDTSTPALPSEKAVTKVMKKMLKKSSNKQMKFKALRKQVQHSFSLKADKEGKKKLKCLLQQCVDSNPEKLVMNGQIVTLTK